MAGELRRLSVLHQAGELPGTGIFMDDRGIETDLQYLRAEYRRWCADVKKARHKNPISLRGWAKRWRQRAEEEFTTLKREASAKNWGMDDLHLAVRRLLRTRGYFFGDVGFLADTWARTMQGARQIVDMPSPFDTFAQQRQGEAGVQQQHLDVTQSSQMGPPLGPCSCGAVVSSTRNLNWGLDIQAPGYDRPVSAFVCERPGCGSMLHFRDFAEEMAKPEPRWIRCSDCQTQMCLNCGARKPHKLLSKGERLGDVVMCYAYELASGKLVPGSRPFKAASRRAGFQERKLSDLYLDAHERRLADSAGSESLDDFAIGETEGELLDRIRDAGLTPGHPGARAMLRRRQDRQDEKESLFKDLVRRHDQDDLVLPSKRQVARPRFTCIGVQDLGDEWFTKRNRELYDMAAALAEKWFGDVDFPENYEGSPWLEDLKPQLVRYANEVAHEDLIAGPWDVVLKDRRRRKWLVVGVLAQIIERKIFSELLFGATEAQADELEHLDRVTLRGDGYRRKALFAELTSTYLSSTPTGTLPLNFWSSVDTLSAHTLQILLPLLNMLSYFRPPSEWSPLLPMYEDIHTLVAHAGFFSVQMRRSPDTVFHVLSATPGARMDYPNEGQASYELYRESRDEARRLERIWEAQERQKLADAPHDQITEREKAYRVAQHHRLRGAKVNLAVWPGIKRYHALRTGVEMEVHPQATADDYARRGEGQRVVDIGKVVVVYYQGLIYPQKTTPSPSQTGVGEFEALDGDTLLHHIEKEKQAVDRRWRERYSQTWFSIALTLATLAFLYRMSILRGAFELYGSVQLLFADSLPGELTRAAIARAAKKAVPFLPLVAGLAVLPAVYIPEFRRFYYLFVLAVALWWVASWILGRVSPLVSSVVAQPPPEERTSRSLFRSFWTSS